MKRNIGNFDRILRIVVAAIIAVLYFTNIITGTWSIVLLLIGGILLITGFVSACPLYTLLSVNTHKRRNGNTTV